MNREEAFLSAFEHLFIIGCQLPRMETQMMLPDESRWRALYVFPFHPTCIIDVHIVADMAELIFHVWDQQKIENAFWPWFRQVIKAFELERTPPESLPQGYQFSTSKADLSATQFEWFQEHIASIPQSRLFSDDPKEAPERDGCFFRGSIKIASEPVHTFSTWEGKENEASRYFLNTYQLACSALSEDESKLLLVKMQRYFFGLKYADDHYVFPLID